jgi:hypothetical protein
LNNNLSKSKKSKDKDEKSRSKSKSKSKKKGREGITPGGEAGPSEKKPPSLEQPQGNKSVKLSDNTINPISSQKD